MQLINQNGQNKCLIYSLAMLLDKPVEEVESLLPPVVNRSHHVQEIIDYLWPDYTLVEIEPMPCVGTVCNTVYTPIEAERRFRKYLSNSQGMIICEYAYRPGWHCVAWDGKSMYDPNGKIAPIDSPMYKLIKYLLMIRL